MEPLPDSTSLAVVIRPLRYEDLPQLEWDTGQARYRRLFRSAFDDMLTGGRILLAAEVQGEVVGRLFVQLNSADTRYADGHRRAYLYALRIRAAWQRRGLGTRLIAAAEAALGARGFATAVIAVAKDNAPALRLYQHLGYFIFDEDPGLWYYTDDQGSVQHEQEPSWILQKALGGG